MNYVPTDAPEALQHYFRMWNELDADSVRGHLDVAVSEDCVWVDPRNSHIGRDALLQNVKEFRTNYPTAKLEISSNVDGHHQRYRYEWRIEVNGNLLLDGFDVVTLDDDGLIERVDGFFGMLERTK